MAFVTLSGLISDLKGKLNGSYFQSKKGGVTINNINSRNKSKGSSGFSVARQKSRVSWVSRAWAAITVAEQASWNSAASTMTRVNKNGITYTPSGYQIFCEQNLNLVSVGSAVITGYEADFTVIDMSYITIDATSDTVITYINDQTTSGEDMYLIYATAPQSRGVKSPKSAYRLIDMQDGTVATITINAAYISEFGVLPAGYTIFFKVKAVNTSSGRVEGSKLTKADAG